MDNLEPLLSRKELAVKPDDVVTPSDIAATLRITVEQFEQMWRVHQVFPPPEFIMGETLLWDAKTFKSWWVLWPKYLAPKFKERAERGLVPPPLVIHELPLLDMKYVLPPEEPRASNACSTYFIRAESGGPIKIGKAIDVKKRLATLQTSHSRKLFVLAVIEADREAELHQRFADLRTNGEWFKAEKPLLDFLHTECGVTVTSF